MTRCVSRLQAEQPGVRPFMTSLHVPSPLPKEPLGLTRLDGKRPNGLTLIPWHGDKSRTLDLTVVCTLADSYVHAMFHVSLQVALLKLLPPEGSKNTRASQQAIFQLVAFETRGSLNASSFDFLREVGRRLTASSDDFRETSFLFQRLSVLIQRFNSVLTLESFISTDEDPDL